MAAIQPQLKFVKNLMMQFSEERCSDAFQSQLRPSNSIDASKH